MYSYKNMTNMLKGINPCEITKNVNAKEFLEILNNNRASVVKTEILVPKIGGHGLGGFKVTYKIGFKYGENK